MASLSVEEIAERLCGDVVGDGSLPITGVAGIRDGRPGDVTFLANPRYASALAETQASAVVVARESELPSSAALIRVENPDKAFAEVATWFAPPEKEAFSGIHPSAVIADDVQLEGVVVGACCVIDSGVTIGSGTVIHPGCHIGHHATIGLNCKLFSHVTVREYVEIGDRVIIHNGVVVGSDGFGFAADQDGARTKIPQIGTVAIGNDVEIGANSTIDRARFGKTRIGDWVKIDNLVQIAHNVVIEDHAVIVAQVGISGSSVIKKKAILAGQVGVAGHLVVGEGAIVGAQSGVSKNIPPGSFYFGYPAIPREKWNRVHFHVTRIPELKKKVAALEAKIKELEEALQKKPSKE